MSKKSENKPINRKQVPDLLATKFIKDYTASIAKFPQDKKVEFLEHILQCFDIVEKYWANQTNQNWKIYADKENAFLKKHGNRLKMYRQTRMYLYYGDRHLLSEKGVYTTDEWNELSHEKQILSPEEFSDFFTICRNYLYNERDYLLLEQNPEDEIAEKNAKENLDGATTNLKISKLKRTRQDKMTCLSEQQTVLLIHYLKQERAFLNGEFLKDSDAGKAFAVLTGYSPNTMRIDLGDVPEIKNKINLIELDNLFAKLRIAIGKDLKPK
jgi:hypothetical protein